MKAQFTDDKKTEVYIDFGTHKISVSYESMVVMKDILSALVSERTALDDSIKAKASRLAATVKPTLFVKAEAKK